MIGKRVIIAVAVTVAVICGVMLSTGMATAASDGTAIDSTTSEYGFVGSSVGESTQQLQSTTVAAQQNTDFVFSSYDEVQYSVFWIGQTFVLEGLEPNEYIQLRIKIDDTSSQLKKEYKSDSAGTITVDTGSYSSGEYYMTGGGINEGSDSSSPPDDTFELVSQTFYANIENAVGNAGTAGSTTVLEMNSNRAVYPITVHAYGQLTTEELREIFVENEKSSFDPDQASTRQGGNGITAYDEIRINGVTDSEEHRLDFTDIDAGDYAFEFTSSDTVVDDSNPTISVTEGVFGKVEISSVDLTPTNTVTESPRTYELTFDATDVSADGKRDDFTIEIPQPVALVDVESVTVTNDNGTTYSTSYSENGNTVKFSVDPHPDYGIGEKVDLSFEVDMTLIKSS